MMTSAFAAGLVFASLSASPAWAAFSITAVAGADVCCFAGDNTLVGGGPTLQTDAPVHFGLTPNYNSNYGGVFTASTSNTAGLTSGGVSAFMPGAQGQFPILQPAPATASASADLGMGQLHAYAASSVGSFTVIGAPPGAPPPNTGLTDYYSIATAQASFSTDFQTVNNTGHDVFVSISWQVDGSFSGPALPLQLESSLQMSEDFQNFQFHSGADLDYSLDPSGQVLSRALFGDETFLDSFTTTDLGGDSRLMTGLFDIRNGQGAGTLSALLQLECWQGEICDYGHTSSLSIGPLPDGVSMTFDAPGFLSGATTGGGVPEPAVWALLLLGFGGAGAVLRQRRRTTMA